MYLFSNWAQMRQSTIYYYIIFFNSLFAHTLCASSVFNHLCLLFNSWRSHVPLMLSCINVMVLNLIDDKNLFFFYYLVSQILISARGLIRILSKSTLLTHFLLMNGSLTLAFTQSLHPSILSGCMFMTGKFSSGNYTYYCMSYN